MHLGKTLAFVLGSAVAFALVSLPFLTWTQPVVSPGAAVADRESISLTPSAQAAIGYLPTPRVQIPLSDCEELKATLASLQAQLAEEAAKNKELETSQRAAEEGRDALGLLVLNQSVVIPLESYGLADVTDSDRHAFVSFVSRTGYIPPADVIVQYLTARRAHEARMDEWDARYAALPLGQDDPGYPELRDQKTAILVDWRSEVQRIFGDQEVIRRLFGE